MFFAADMLCQSHCDLDLWPIDLGYLQYVGCLQTLSEIEQSLDKLLIILLPLHHAVTFDPLSLNACIKSVVAWSNTVPNFRLIEQGLMFVDCRLTGHWSCHLLTVLSVVWSIYIHCCRQLYTVTSSVKTFLSVTNLWSRSVTITACTVLGFCNSFFLNFVY